MKRNAPTEPSPSASAFPLTALQNSRFVRPAISEGCCTCPAPAEGAPQSACLCWALDGGQKQGPASNLYSEVWALPQGGGVPVVETRICPSGGDQERQLQTLASLRIVGSGLWGALLVLTPPQHSTHLVRLTFQILGSPHGSTAASQGSVPLSKCAGVAGQHWPPPATSTQLQLSTEPQTEAAMAAGGQG